jgi:RimJ/RimL family protein N-acetyltransferase
MVERVIEGPLTAMLHGDLVTLEPLAEEHRDGLWEAAQPDEIWTWLAHLNKSREYFDGWFDATLASDALEETALAGETGTFAVRRAADGVVVGSSRYLGVRRWDRVVEIGWTWFNPSVWQTGVNVETKLLMLTRAFETLGCVRVELKTDSRNERSRGAMVRLPARFEGIMRKHMIVPDVGQRDSAYYSVIDDEWPATRDALRARLTSTPHPPLMGRKPDA